MPSKTHFPASAPAEARQALASIPVVVVDLGAKTKGKQVQTEMSHSASFMILHMQFNKQLQMQHHIAHPIITGNCRLSKLTEENPRPRRRSTWNANILLCL